MVNKRILHIPDVEQITGFHRSTLRRWWEKGNFPVPQKLNGTTLVWSIQIINQWIEENVQGGRHHEDI